MATHGCSLEKSKLIWIRMSAFLASETLIKQIPRLLGPGLSKGILTTSSSSD